MHISVVILAAGLGTRMAVGQHNPKPKTSYEVAGRSMLGHVLTSAVKLNPQDITIVIGPAMEALREEAARYVADTIRLDFVIQAERFGTAHALAQAFPLPASEQAGLLCVLYGDTPLITGEFLQKMVKVAQSPHSSMVVAGFESSNPTGFGRLIRETGVATSLNGQSLVAAEDEDFIKAIVEEREATPEERAITLCNSGVMVFDRLLAASLVAAIDNQNQKGEYYLTDAVKIARERGLGVRLAKGLENELLGVDSPQALADAERLWQDNKRRELARQGVRMIAPETIFFSADSQIEPAARLDPYIVLGMGVRIEAGAHIKSFSHLEGCHIGKDCEIGPYARLRPGAFIAEQAKVGNFVEIKKSRLGKGAKASHLSYLGDATIGEGANIGAGTITCNYDGFGKHDTHIGDGAFIGSNSSLVAPLLIGEGAIIGAGSVITREVAPQSLALTRAPQKEFVGHAPKIRQRAAEAANLKKSGKSSKLSKGE